MGNRIYHLGLLILFAVLLCPAFSFSEEKSDEGSAIRGDEIVVTADRGEKDVFLSARSIAVMDRKTLNEISPRTTPEALWDMPGTFVQSTNFGGGSPIIRGFIGPQVLIMVDGVRLNNSTYRTGPVQYLNFIDSYSIDRIEVLRGPGSVLYGSDAMGGVIQVFPIGPGDFSNPNHLGGGANISSRYSSADNGRVGHAHADFGYGPFGILAGGTLRAFDNLYGGKGIDEQIYSEYDNYSAIGKFNLQFDKFGASIGYLFSEFEDVGRTDKFFDNGSLSMYDNQDHLVYMKLNGKITPIKTDVILTASYQDFFERKDGIQFDTDLQTELGTTRDETFVATTGTDLQISTRVLGDRLRFVYGGMWYADLVNATRESRATPNGEFEETLDKPYPDGSTYDNYGAYIMASGDPLFTKSGHVISLNGGYRWHGMVGFAPEENNLPQVDFSYNGNVFLGGVQYTYASLANIAFTFSQGFRSPNLQEAIQLGDTGKFFHIPNDGLTPETADTYELITRGRFWKFEVSQAAYVTYVNDIIIREETVWKGDETVGEKPVVHNINSGEGEIRGLESQMFFDIGWGFSCSGHLTYTWGQQEQEDGRIVPLTRIPPLFAQTNLRYTTKSDGNWNGFIEVFARGANEQDRLSDEDKTDTRIPANGTPEWWTWNLRTGLAAYDLMRLGLTIENITNEKYKYHASGIYAPGTNAVLTAEFAF